MVNEAFNMNSVRFYAYARRARQMLRRFDVESDLDDCVGALIDAEGSINEANNAWNLCRKNAHSESEKKEVASMWLMLASMVAEFERADKAPWRIYRALHKIEKELEASSSGTILLANGDDIDFIDRRGPVKETAREVLNHVAELYHLDEMGAAQHILDGDIQDGGDGAAPGMPADAG